MKLVFCGACGDIVKLPIARWRSCACGAAGGGYADALHDFWAGPAGSEPLGFQNAAFEQARAAAAADRKHGRARRLGHEFDAFVIPWNAPTMRGCARARVFTPDEADAAAALASATGARVEILRNAAQCRTCGDTLVGWRDRHDMQRCTCGRVAVDGGADYRKITGQAVSDALFVVAYPADGQSRG